MEQTDKRSHGNIKTKEKEIEKETTGLTGSSIMDGESAVTLHIELMVNGGVFVGVFFSIFLVSGHASYQSGQFVQGKCQ